MFKKKQIKTKTNKQQQKQKTKQKDYLLFFYYLFFLVFVLLLHVQFWDIEHTHYPNSFSVCFGRCNLQETLSRLNQNVSEYIREYFMCVFEKKIVIFKNRYTDCLLGWKELVFDCEGAVETLFYVLESSHTRPDEEKRCAVTLLTRLVTDPLNRHVCQVKLCCVMYD